MIKKSTNKGFSLIEMLIVMAVFSVLVVMITQGIVGSLRSSKKSESEIIVKENLDYAISVIERQLHNSKGNLVCDPSNLSLTYSDQHGQTTSFGCVTSGTNSYIASGSAQLTSLSVNINQGCTTPLFSCFSETGINGQPSVSVNLIGTTKNVSGVTGSTITNTTNIYLRTY